MNTPTKFTWSNDAEFIIRGNELEWLINMVNTNLSTPEAQRILALAQTGSMLEVILSKGVETGVVTQVVEDIKEDNKTEDNG